MKRFVAKLVLSVSSFSGILLFLLIGKQTDVPFIGFEVLNYFGNAPKYFVFLAVTIACAWVALNIAKLLLPENESMDVVEIRPIESNYLPVYIGLFVIALELGGSLTIETLFLLGLLFVFWSFLESVSYFNPFLLLFGYRFYEVRSPTGVAFTLITKQKDIKNLKRAENLKRINNFTFLET